MIDMFGPKQALDILDAAIALAKGKTSAPSSSTASGASSSSSIALPATLSLRPAQPGTRVESLNATKDAIFEGGLLDETDAAVIDKLEKTNVSGFVPALHVYEDRPKKGRHTATRQSLVAHPPASAPEPLFVESSQTDLDGGSGS